MGTYSQHPKGVLIRPHPSLTTSDGRRVALSPLKSCFLLSHKRLLGFHLLDWASSSPLLIVPLSNMGSASIELRAVGQTSGAETPTSNVNGSTSTPDDSLENQLQNHEFSLPPVDGGKDALLFLAAAFMLEALVWGQSRRADPPRMRA
jgi:hypothetical protein